MSGDGLHGRQALEVVGVQVGNRARPMIFAGVPKFQNFEVVDWNEKLFERIKKFTSSLFVLLLCWISLSQTKFFSTDDDVFSFSFFQYLQILMLI